MWRHLLSALLLGTLLLASRGAAAGPDPEIAKAKALFQRAEVHFSVGEFRRALELYTEAFKQKPLPGFLFNIGQCHRNLGEHGKALFFYRQYLLRSGDPPNKEEVIRLIEICERNARSQPVSRPASAPATRPMEPPPPSSRLATPATRPLPPDPLPPPPSRRRLRPLWFWSGVALSAALLGTGVATGVLALQKSSDYKDPATSIPHRQELRDSGQTLSTTATVTVGLGAAAAVGTIVLSFFTRFGEAERPLALTPVPGGAAAFLGGVF